MSTQQPFSNSDLFIQICFLFYSCHPGLDVHYPASVPDHRTSLPPTLLFLTLGQKPTMSLHWLLKYEICVFFRVFLNIMWSLSNSMFHCPQDILQLQQNLTICYSLKRLLHVPPFVMSFSSVGKSSIPQPSLHTNLTSISIKSRRLSWSYLLCTSPTHWHGTSCYACVSLERFLFLFPCPAKCLCQLSS